jgi:RNA polymerase sigma-70 factor (ECF subfamily)
MSDLFETHRSFLTSLAYRMLGSVAEAEDVVQDAFLRWRDIDPTSVEHPRAYLARTVSRLCLDRMKSASARREAYVGTWLPEPVVADPPHGLADDLSVALLLTLERLSPLERAAFLLHDVFDMDYAVVADTLGRTEAATRQLAARARDHVRQERPRFETTDEERQRLAASFLMALKSGDATSIAELLAEQAVLYTDGGGKRRAAINPIYGRDRIVRFFTGIERKFGIPPVLEVVPAMLNGLPGCILKTEEGVETLAVDIQNGLVVAIYGVRNPDKLRHLA